MKGPLQPLQRIGLKDNSNKITNNFSIIFELLQPKTNQTIRVH